MIWNVGTKSIANATHTHIKRARIKCGVHGRAGEWGRETCAYYINVRRNDEKIEWRRGKLYGDTFGWCDRRASCVRYHCVCVCVCARRDNATEIIGPVVEMPFTFTSAETNKQKKAVKFAARTSFHEIEFHRNPSPFPPLHAAPSLWHYFVPLLPLASPSTRSSASNTSAHIESAG